MKNYYQILGVNRADLSTIPKFGHLKLEKINALFLSLNGKIQQ